MPHRVEKLLSDLSLACTEILAHGYDVIDDVTLWDLATNRVPELLNQAESYLIAVGA